MDIVMSGSYVTEERLKTITVSQPYFQSPTALIVPSRKADLFIGEFTIKTLSHLKVAVLNDPVGRPFVRRIFPGADIVALHSFDELPTHPEIDAALWTFVQGSIWTALHPGYTAVVPKNLGSAIMFAYMMPPKSADLARFVNYWLNMRKADGFEKKQRDYWIMGKPRQDRKHRWCVIRNVLHWVG